MFEQTNSEKDRKIQCETKAPLYNKMFTAWAQTTYAYSSNWILEKYFEIMTFFIIILINIFWSYLFQALDKFNPFCFCQKKTSQSLEFELAVTHK